LVRRLAYSRLPRGRNCTVCQFRSIAGFADIRSGNSLQITPSFSMAVTHAPSAASGAMPVAFDPQVGVTGRWKLTPTLSLNGVYNPDFSQVEADAIQLKVNRQFTLYYPERRPFFLEGADFFQTPLNVLYSRQIAALEWGMKLAGKMDDGNAVGAIVAKDTITNLVLPGPESSKPLSIASPSASAALRWRWDVGKSSNFGVLIAGRTGKDYFNSILGADGSLRYRQNHTVRFQLLESYTRYPEVAITWA
jgi:Domain of unknown function (DUF5916)